MKQRLKQLAINPMPMTPAEMDKHVVAELSSNEKLLRAAGIKLELPVPPAKPMSDKPIPRS
jgi:tripartite-type tricarboxylate transporter receptor subunit TctC